MEVWDVAVRMMDVRHVNVITVRHVPVMTVRPVAVRHVPVAPLLLSFDGLNNVHRRGLINGS